MDLNAPLSSGRLFDFGDHPPRLWMLIAFILILALVDSVLCARAGKRDEESVKQAAVRLFPLSLLFVAAWGLLLLMAGMLACFVIITAVAVVAGLFGAEGPYPTARVVVSWISFILTLSGIAYLAVTRRRKFGVSSEREQTG